VPRQPRGPFLQPSVLTLLHIIPLRSAACIPQQYVFGQSCNPDIIVVRGSLASDRRELYAHALLPRRKRALWR